jgi:type I restriction enzyme M protein
LKTSTFSLPLPDKTQKRRFFKNAHNYMAVKKSELYSSLWASCDELRGSMDASQYKDYVLVLLFMKYVSDKRDPLVELKAGTTFADMLKYRGKSDIGDKINTIIGEFAKNNSLSGVLDVADFNDDAKLGTGKDKVDRLTNLLNIFNKPELNFSGNRADGDDLLGDAYEYLMRHFATESGKSKGQFYTPSEVSRIMAEVIGIRRSRSQEETIYDPTCGSGSLLLKAADLAPHGITIYGQENDNATRALAVMNMWLHNFSDADIKQGNTLASPQFTDEKTGALKQFDYGVSNPPFSYKSWTNGLNPENDNYHRFVGYAVPPQKNGDFAFLLHLIKSLKSKGKACIVLPLGVLFRGNAESEIRKKLIQLGYIKAVIGLPPNLFFGTGIAACLVIIDKEGADKRDSIFLIDASKGFIKDGNKNRLREQDIHKIVDAFNTRANIPKYSRSVPVTEIADQKNDYNLNIPRYIDSQEAEDIQDIEAHLNGGLPRLDIEALEGFWKVYPSLKNHLFSEIAGRPNYYQLNVSNSDIRESIYCHPEFTTFAVQMDALFVKWKNVTTKYCESLDKGIRPKQEIRQISENLLKQYDGQPLTDKYTMYQHLMDYWAETMQDDFYEIAAEGWEVGKQVKRIEKKTKKGDKEIVKTVAGLEGLEGILIPPTLLIREYFAADQKELEGLEASVEELDARMQELLEEHGSEDGLLANAVENGKISKASLSKAIKAAQEAIKSWRKKKPSPAAAGISEDAGDASDAEDGPQDELDMLVEYKELIENEAEAHSKIKVAKAALENKIIAKYPRLSIDKIKTIVVEQKWMEAIEKRIKAEMENISLKLTGRIIELADRYEKSLKRIGEEVELMDSKVKQHLNQMYSR